MPLNLQPPADEPEEKMVPAALVQATAKAYAEKYDLCEVVDEALAEMGVGRVTDESVQCYAIVNVPHVVDFYADPHQWVGISPEEEVQRITALIRASRPARITVREIEGVEEGDYDLFGPVEVVSLSTEKPQPPTVEVGGVTIPSGWHPKFAGDKGTVAHLAASVGYDLAACGADDLRDYDGRKVGGVCKRCSAAIS